MADFSHLKQLDVTRDMRSRFTLHSIQVNGVSPTLILRPATEQNPAYFNALIKRNRKAAQIIQAGGVTAGLIAQNRNEDRELFPAHVIDGWENMLEADGAEVPFNLQNCRDFVNALPDYIFDTVRDHAGTHRNFVPDAPDPGEVEELAKN